MNTLWWEQVEELQQAAAANHKPIHYKEAEIELFRLLYLRMREGGYTETQIREHFHSSFEMKQTAYYTRLRKVGMKHVL